MEMKVSVLQPSQYTMERQEQANTTTASIDLQNRGNSNVSWTYISELDIECGTEARWLLRHIPAVLKVPNPPLNSNTISENRNGGKTGLCNAPWQHKS